jgi:hypothetical protein
MFQAISQTVTNPVSPFIGIEKSNSISNGQGGLVIVAGLLFLGSMVAVPLTEGSAQSKYGVYATEIEAFYNLNKNTKVSFNGYEGQCVSLSKLWIQRLGGTPDVWKMVSGNRNIGYPISSYVSWQRNKDSIVNSADQTRVVDITKIEDLQAGDIVFLDTSHITNTSFKTEVIEGSNTENSLSHTGIAYSKAVGDQYQLVQQNDPVNGSVSLKTYNKYTFYGAIRYNKL